MTFRTCWLLALLASCGVMPPGPTDGGGRNLLTGGGGVSFGTGGGSTGGGFAAAGGSTAGGSTAGGSTAGGSTAGGSTAGGSTAGGSSAGGQSAGGQAGGSSINATNLVAGQAVRVNSTGATGNPQRNYRIVVPSGKTEIVLSLSGGTCSPHTCIGGDVELYLKRGALPDAFSPDGTTTRWTFTPGGTGRYSKPAVAGDTWYLGIIDGANTLGYRDVALTIYPAGPTCDGSGTPCATASQCCTNQCIPTGPSTKICG